MSLVLAKLEDDIFIKFGLNILKKRGYADFTDYYQKLNAIENELTVILYDINDAINSKRDDILIEKYTELSYLKEDISTYICKFKMNADAIDAYFNDIKLERITPSRDSVVCDLKEEWFIRMKKLEQIYDNEKMKHSIKVEKSIAPSSGWSLTSSISKFFNKLTVSSTNTITQSIKNIEKEAPKPLQYNQFEHSLPDDVTYYNQIYDISHGIHNEYYPYPYSYNNVLYI